MRKPKVAVIIVGYNSRVYLKDCLSSVFNSSYKNIKVYFVDNNSSDGSVDFVVSKYGEVKIISEKKNIGFAGANNLGINMALSDQCEYIFLLNPDTITEKNCIEILINESKDNYILQPLILLHENNKKTNLINTTGNYLNFLGFSYCNNYRDEERGQNKKEIISASGAAMFIPTKILLKIGFLDEHLFMYYEDLDFCIKARLFNNKIFLIPNAKVWHKYYFSRNSNKLYLAERNRLLFLYKNFSSRYLFLIMPALIVNEILVLCYSIFTLSFILKIKSYVSVIKLLKTEKNARKINSKQFGQITELKKFIGWEIRFSEFKSPGMEIYNLFLNFYWRLIKKII